MTGLLAHALLFALCTGGFILLLLAMARHQADWLGRPLPARQCRLLRLTGFGTLLLAAVLAGRHFGWGNGAIVWCGWLSIGALATVILNFSRSRTARKQPERQA